MLDKEKRFKKRIEFVKWWADYIRNNTNEAWSKQQADFIDSVLKTADQDVELYLRVKEKAKSINK